MEISEAGALKIIVTPAPVLRPEILTKRDRIIYCPGYLNSVGLLRNSIRARSTFANQRLMYQSLLQDIRKPVVSS
jgi:hypothetical protein